MQPLFANSDTWFTPISKVEMIMRKVFLVLLVTLMWQVSPATRADTTLKISILTPDGSYWTTALKEAGSKVAEKTGNRVQFRFYPGGVMGSDTAVLKKMRIGQLHGGVLSAGSIAPYAPDAQIYTIPLQFNSYAEIDYVRKQLDSEIERRITDAGYVNFGLAEGGFAYVMSKAPIADVNELRKNKVWAPSDDAAAAAAAETFQLTPVTLGMGDVLTGLQTGMINTITASPIAAIALQWHTQVNYITDIPIAYFTLLMVVDKKAFDRIAPADQKIVHEVMREAVQKLNARNRIDNDNAMLALKKQGIELVKPTPDQLRVWNEKTHVAADIFASKGKISPTLQQRINVLLAEYRKNVVAAK